MSTNETYLGAQRERHEGRLALERRTQEMQRQQRAAASGPAPERGATSRVELRRGQDRRRAVPSAAGPSAAARGAVLLVVVTVLVALGGGWAVTAATSPTYRTEAKVLVLPAGDGGASGASAAAVAAQAPTWAALAQTPAVLDPALEASGLDLASTQAVAAVSATPEPGTSIITIEAQGASARAAAQLASAAAASLVEQVATRSTVGGTPQVAGSVVQEPEVPVAPASPDLLLNLATAAAVGLAVALAILLAARALAVRRREGAGDRGRDADGGEGTAGAEPGESGPTPR